MLVGAVLAGLPSVVAVLLGVHWLGAAVAIGLFALWCARLPREPGLPARRVLVGAALAGLPSILAVVLGVHWLGAAVAIGLFALWCARLAREPGLPARAV